MSRQQSSEGNGSADGSRRDRFVERRRFLMATGALAGVGVLAGCAESGDTNGSDGGDGGPSLEERYPGLRILSPEPENAEAAARSTYTDYITPREEHYIRNHYPTPDIQESDWSVSLTGLVDDEVDLSMEEIKHSFSTDSVTHTMQCAGNGRSYFDPKVGGNQWTFGAVGNTVWTGTPVSEILEYYGAETGEGYFLTVMGGEHPEGEDVFTRSIPMEKVLDDTLLAYNMNGSPVSPDHGFPVRLLVPGWFGCNNVKWVNRMHVMETMVIGDEWEEEGAPEDGQRTYTHWQQYSYRIVPEEDDGAEHYEDIPVYDTREQMEQTDAINNAYMYDQVEKSLIGYPGEGQTVSPSPAGTIEVIGVAWAGDDGLDMVEVSTDGGDSWGEAEFFGPVDGSSGWRQFRYVWEDPSTGDHTLASRATDDRGYTQPATISDPDAQLRSIADDQYPWNQSGYGNNAYMPHAVDCTVEES
ncbi:molybdopterin-binding oxidoreductase [Haloterrigena sp. H1]|uniref:sulfite oxidase n=1 Tax=Haloterrigena sp. H1 TaxID=2552943 RepID=UPI00110D29B3|nr:sulfite oxidase [Haloterrigena sp. H1]TMT85742.1 molybdopterin-binding oxidoreductase [Haloterrigena sp. H1]